MRAPPVPNVSAEGLEDLSSLHTDTLRTRPHRHPTRMPEVGQLSFVTEGPYPSELLGFVVDLGTVLAFKEDLKVHQEPKG